MHQTITLNRHPIDIEMTPDAHAAAEALDQPLHVEMELYFSCLIRKRLRFMPGQPGPDAARIGNHLTLGFRPVMTAQCGKDYEGDEPPLTDFPIAQADRFIPDWVRIDYRHGQWQGEFGYH